MASPVRFERWFLRSSLVPSNEVNNPILVRGEADRFEWLFACAQSLERLFGDLPGFIRLFYGSLVRFQCERLLKTLSPKVVEKEGSKRAIGSKHISEDASVRADER